MTPVQRACRWLALGCASLAFVPGYYAVMLRWHAPADFDVAGFLFVLQNLPRVTALALTALSLAGATYFMVKSRQA